VCVCGGLNWSFVGGGSHVTEITHNRSTSTSRSTDVSWVHNHSPALTVRPYLGLYVATCATRMYVKNDADIAAAKFNYGVNPLTPTVAIWIGYHGNSGRQRVNTRPTTTKLPVPDRVNAVICNFWHPGTLMVTVECQSARMSKITMADGLTWSSTGNCCSTHIATVGVKGLTLYSRLYACFRDQTVGNGLTQITSEFLPSFVIVIWLDCMIVTVAASLGVVYVICFTAVSLGFESSTFRIVSFMLASATSTPGRTHEYVRYFFPITYTYCTRAP